MRVSALPVNFLSFLKAMCVYTIHLLHDTKHVPRKRVIHDSKNPHPIIRGEAALTETGASPCWPTPTQKALQLETMDAEMNILGSAETPDLPEVSSVKHGVGWNMAFHSLATASSFTLLSF